MPIQPRRVSKQLIVRTRFGDLAPFHDDDAMRIAYCRQPVAEAVALVRANYMLLQDPNVRAGNEQLITRQSLLNAARKTSISLPVREAAALLSTPGFFQLLDVGAENQYFDRSDGAVSHRDLDLYLQHDMVPTSAEQVAALVSAAAIYNLAGTNLSSASLPGTGSVQQSAASIVGLMNLETQLTAARATDNFGFPTTANSSKDTEATYIDLQRKIKDKISAIVSEASAAGQPWSDAVRSATAKLFDTEVGNGALRTAVDVLRSSYAASTVQSLQKQLASTKPSSDGSLGNLLSTFVSTSTQLALASGATETPMQLLARTGGAGSGLQAALARFYQDQMVSGSRLQTLIDQGVPLDAAVDAFMTDTLGLTATFFMRGGQDTTTYVGNAGADRYVAARGVGKATILDQDATRSDLDSLDFTDSAQTELWFRRIDNDLQVAIMGTGDKIDISGWYAEGAKNHIERIKTSDGRTLYDTDIEQLVQAMAAFAPPGAAQTHWTPGQTSHGKVLLTVTH